MKKLLFTIILSIWSLASELEITAQINEDLSTKNLAFISFEFKNNTEDWIELSNQKVSFGNDADKYIEVIDSKKLEVYFDYIKELEKEKTENKSFLSSLSSIATFILPYSSALSTASVMGTYTLSPDETNVKDLDKNRYPKGHLYNSIIVAPGLSAKKYIVISSKYHDIYGYLNWLKFKFFKDNKEFTEDILFRADEYTTVEDPEFEKYRGKQKQVKHSYIWQSDLNQDL